MLDCSRNDVKNNAIARALIRGARDLDRAVNSRLRRLQRNCDKVRAFFQMDTTRYAAAGAPMRLGSMSRRLTVPL